MRAIGAVMSRNGGINAAIYPRVPAPVGRLDTRKNGSSLSTLSSRKNLGPNRPTAMPAANDIRKGQVIKFNGEPHLVMETQHRTPGNLRAFVQIKMRNLRYGKALDQRFASTDSIEVLPTDRRTLEFSYADRESYAFMDPNTFEQIELSAQTLGDVTNYLTAGGKVDVLFVDEKALTVELPSTVSLKVIESAEGVKGDTASNVQKPAKLETGLTVQVPLFIKEGEIIKVSTVDGSYLGRS
jgi:elongation factor P